MAQKPDKPEIKAVRRRTPVWLYLLTGLYVLFLAALTGINRVGPDRWWFGDVNLFLPQAIWLVPGIVLALVSLLIARQWLWAPLLCMLWVLGPVMDFHWRFGSGRESIYGRHTVRVMSCNVKYGNRDLSALVDDISRYTPDIVILQDANAEMMEGPLGQQFAKWNVRYRADNKYIVASKFPLGPVDIRLIPYRGELHSCLRCLVRIGSTQVAIYNVHFSSPRDGLYEFTSSRRNPESLPKAAINIKMNQEDRLSQARALYEQIQLEPGPVIVAGDLNSSDASMICRTLRNAGLHDAFAEGGRGYGYTYGHYLLRNKHPRFNRSWMRIDHIMLSSSLEALDCWTGTSEASDHRPVYADIVVKGERLPSGHK